ncbi:hypothetical protein [Bifidobacterium cebidarum]|uniref:hypothetical protein n=1 Tax=Bifidobacterium cebidarum TaxID=2650773 RepID=UPI0012642E89|nr:hypothetical protein [Bifidobacterium cebidarum]
MQADPFDSRTILVSRTESATPQRKHHMIRVRFLGVVDSVDADKTALYRHFTGSTHTSIENTP